MLSAGGRSWPCIAGAGKPQELLDWHRRARRPNPEVFLQASRGSERLQNLARDVAKLKFDPDPSFLCLLLPLRTSGSARSGLSLVVQAAQRQKGLYSAKSMGMVSGEGEDSNGPQGRRNSENHGNDRRR